MNAQDDEKAQTFPRLEYYGPLGKKGNLDTGVMLRMAAQPRFAGFVLLAGTVLVLLDALAIRDELNLAATLWLWSTTLALHVLFRVAINLGWAAGQRRFGFWRIYQPLLTHMALALDGLQFSVQHALLTGTPWRNAFDARKMLVGYGIFVTFELFFFVYVRPDLEDRARAAADSSVSAHEAAQPAPARQVSLGGELVPVDTLITIRSRAHYVDVVHDGGALTRRARLIDLINQTEPPDGVHAHRSHWVARRAIAAILSESGGMPEALVLTNGERMAVARPRREAVLEWLREHRPELVRQWQEGTGNGTGGNEPGPS
jgi:hypothetical protein